MLLVRKITSQNKWLNIPFNLHKSHWGAYYCKQDNGPQSFSSTSRFKRHLLKSHSDVLSAGEFQNISASANELLIGACSRTNIVPAIEDVVSDISQPPQEDECNKIDSRDFISSFKESIEKSLEKSALQFTLNFHGKSTFNRKDVIEVQRNVTTHITSVLKNDFDYRILQMHLEKIELIDIIRSSLENPSKRFDTEHKLFSYLKISELIQFPKMYTINK